MRNALYKQTLKFLRAGVLLGVMALMFTSVNCIPKHDQVTDDPSAQGGGSTGAGGKAAKDLELGDDCESDKECDSGNCQDKVCTEQGDLKIGVDCSGDGVCASGNCDDDKCVPGDGSLDDGEECTGDVYCASEKCDENVCAEGGPSFSLGQKMMIFREAIDAGNP